MEVNLNKIYFEKTRNTYFSKKFVAARIDLSRLESVRPDVFDLLQLESVRPDVFDYFQQEASSPTEEHAFTAPQRQRDSRQRQARQRQLHGLPRLFPSMVSQFLLPSLASKSCSSIWLRVGGNRLTHIILPFCFEFFVSSFLFCVFSRAQT